MSAGTHAPLRRRQRAPWWVARCSLALGLAGLPAAAQPGPRAPLPAELELDYQRAARARSCMEPRELVRAVERRLGRRVFAPSGARAELRAQLRAERSQGAFRIQVELFDRARRSLGRRELRTRARHCSALDDSLALVVSLAVDVATAPAASEPAASQPAAALGPVVALATPIDVPEETPAPRAGWRVRPSLGVTALGGMLPSLGWGPHAELELGVPGFWPVFVGGTAWLSQRVGAGAARAEFDAQSVELGVCPWTPLLGSLESRLCAQQLIARIGAEGTGFDQDQAPGGMATFALGVRETLSLRLGDWFVSVSGSLLVPLIQRRYFYRDAGEITLHDQGWVWGSGSISVGFEP